MIELQLFVVFLILNSVAIFGINVATNFDYLDEEEGLIDADSKMIGWKFRYRSLKYIGKFWSKPLFTCPPCMASVHSTYFYLFFLSLIHFQLPWIVFYPAYVFILAGLNYIIGEIIHKQ